ncbi:uncharacterized protein C8A04DRAFT_28720 [Dichotomopilus funicola]|uniref:Uncharacterized protein n=1 Tax=Dichotomopilus funicola TaxID=1934379 RepID=A0AAN6ZMN4_9PEZI|nr:hypothetical protein C8A04DRAFT_28720 [Dichotomopilus funicola]
MASRAHSLRLPLPTPRRPIHPQRAASSSSEASHLSNSSPRSHASEDPFVLSPVQTPAHETTVPPRVMFSRLATDPAAARNGLLLGKEVPSRPRDSTNKPVSPSLLRIANSKSGPTTAIDVPVNRKSVSTTSAETSTPLEPLSARGDLPGGYFPLHEEEPRVHIPHPFQVDTDMARRSSVQRAAESCQPSVEPSSFSSAHNPRPTRGKPTNTLSTVTSPDTPISSYNPTGLHDDVVLPLGKYYPSNWERRHGKGPPSRPTTAGAHSEPQVPKSQDSNPSSPHAQRPGSDVKRRLQQYQRDMIAQAAMAANALIVSSGSAGSGGSGSSIASSLRGLTLPQGHLATTFLKTHKPRSPRLEPVGSPGPVTPMSLEADSYLSLGAPVDVEAGGKGPFFRHDVALSPSEMTTASI